MQGLAAKYKTKYTLKKKMFLQFSAYFVSIFVISRYNLIFLIFILLYSIAYMYSLHMINGIM